jgi:hypothetical protein
MTGGVESDLEGPEDVARRALTWFLRGGTWPALARELAWTAVQAAGANYATIDWLTPLVEARLAERVDGLEYQVDMDCVRARHAHMERRPGDRDGAAAAATHDGFDSAVQRLSRLYLEEVEWAAALIADRLESGRRGRRHSPLEVRRKRPPADVEIPRDVANELARHRAA